MLRWWSNHKNHSILGESHCFHHKTSLLAPTFNSNMGVLPKWQLTPPPSNDCSTPSVCFRESKDRWTDNGWFAMTLDHWSGWAKQNHKNAIGTFGKPGISLSVNVVTWNCNILVSSDMIWAAAPFCSLRRSWLLALMMSASLCVRSSYVYIAKM